MLDVFYNAALPTLDIAEGALDKIFGIYKELLPAMGGYLTEAGQLNRRRLQLLLDRLAQLEQHTLELRAQVRGLPVSAGVSSGGVAAADSAAAMADAHSSSRFAAGSMPVCGCSFVAASGRHPKDLVLFDDEQLAHLCPHQCLRMPTILRRRSREAAAAELAATAAQVWGTMAPPMADSSPSGRRPMSSMRTPQSSQMPRLPP